MVEKCTLYHVKLSIAIFFNLKKSLVFNFYTKCKLILNTMLSLKLTKYFKVCSTFVHKSQYVLFVFFFLFLIHRSELKYYY